MSLSIHPLPAGSSNDLETDIIPSTEDPFQIRYNADLTEAGS